VADAENDFLRVRRRQVMSRLSAWLRRSPDDVNIMLPFDEVVAALGRTGERRRGLQVIPLDSIVGSVDRTRDFDRRFRPPQAVEGTLAAVGAGAATGRVDPADRGLPRRGDAFRADGHHRVSVAYALGLKTIEAYVTEVTTRLNPSGIRYRGDLLVKDYRRIFLSRVPLEGEARAAISLTDPWDYAELAECVEAWGFRLMQDENVLIDRPTVAQRWYDEEFRPVVQLLRQAAWSTRRPRRRPTCGWPPSATG